MDEGTANILAAATLAAAVVAGDEKYLRMPRSTKAFRVMQIHEAILKKMNGHAPEHSVSDLLKAWDG